MILKQYKHKAPNGLFKNRRKATWFVKKTPKLIRRDLISGHNYNRRQVRSVLIQLVIATEITIGGSNITQLINDTQGYSLIWSIQVCAAGQGMVFDLSVLNKVYNSV